MLSDEAIRQLVLSRPLPDRLLQALARAPLLRDLTPAQAFYCRRWGVPTGDPEDLPPAIRRTLTLLCHGLTTREVADATGFAVSTVNDHRKVLLAVFRARNAPHLAALAVAQGFVTFVEAS